MQTAGVNGLNIKKKNRGLLLRLLSCGIADSRAGLTKISGLTKMTVSNIISEFLQEGYVVETEIEKNKNRGCNPMGLMISKRAPKAVAVAISRDKVAACIIDLTGKPCSDIYAQILAEESPKTLEQKLISVIRDALAQTKDRILGIGAASIGPVHAGSGVILNPVNFFGITNFPLKHLLEQTFQLPVMVNNDMNAAALAEKLYGAGAAYENFVYLGMTNGIGAGVIADGRLYYNQSGFSGEAGHMSVQADGGICFCGNRGCLELYASIPVITKQLKQALSLERTPNPHEFSTLYQMPAGKEIFQKMEHYLTAGLVNLANLFSPQVIIIGHDGYYFPEEMLERMEKNINRRVLFTGWQTVRLLRSSFENQAALTGAACCVFHSIFEG
ncbi:ROK family protein [Oscillospiraceae bacterium DSM 107454]|uniref:ROK family protein n=2 Tax=Ructibacterium gallinarum TaxID=2779355 RepID=A0A9D5M1H8_9FIRM|nr:ROK family protein [Ructibacterium gallinarum]